MASLLRFPFFLFLERATAWQNQATRLFVNHTERHQVYFVDQAKQTDHL